MTIMEAIKSFLARMHVDCSRPLDKIQLDAAQDRLLDRTRKVHEATDALTEMLKRMTREDKVRESEQRKRKRGKHR